MTHANVKITNPLKSDLLKFVDWAAPEFPQLLFQGSAGDSRVRVFDGEVFIGEVASVYSWKTSKTSLKFTGTRIKMERGDGKKSANFEVAKKIFKKYFYPVTVEEHVKQAYGAVRRPLHDMETLKNRSAYKVNTHFGQEAMTFVMGSADMLAAFSSHLSNNHPEQVNYFNECMEDYKVAVQKSEEVLQTSECGWLVSDVGNELFVVSRIENKEVTKDTTTKTTYDALPDEVKGPLSIMRMNNKPSLYIEGVGMKVGNAYYIKREI